MTNLNGSREPVTPPGKVACRQCGATNSTTDTTCSRCGTDLFAPAARSIVKNGSSNGAARAARRRIGGTSWTPEVTAAHDQPAAPANSSPNGRHAGRRRLGSTSGKAVANGTPSLRVAPVDVQPTPTPSPQEPAEDDAATPPAIAESQHQQHPPPTQPTAPRAQTSITVPAPASKRQRKRRRRSASAAERTLTPPADVAPAVSTAIAMPVAQTATRESRSRRRRRRPWYRRPLLVAPLAVVGVILLALGFITYRAESTINAIHKVSTPPPVVADATLDDDPIWDSIQLNTGPAQQAVRAIAASEGKEEPDGDDGGFGRVKDAASNVGDLASGAAVAAGITDVTDESRTILVMGVDAQPGAPIDIAVRPDAMMVVRLDEATNTCRLLAIPRDTRTRLPGYGQTKINHALMVGGIPYQQLVVEQLLNLDVDNYVLVDFVGFEKLVDAVGGITINVPEVLDDRGVHFDAGLQTLDGERALAYVRYRADEQGDLGRIRRQWAVLEALLETGSKRDLVGDVNSIMPALEDHLRSDLDTTDFAAIAETYGGHCTVETIDTVLLGGLRVRLDDPMLQQSVYYNVVTDQQIRDAVDALLGKTPAVDDDGEGASAGREGQFPLPTPMAMTQNDHVTHARWRKRYRKVSL